MLDQGSCTDHQQRAVVKAYTGRNTSIQVERIKKIHPGVYPAAKKLCGTL